MLVLLLMNEKIVYNHFQGTVQRCGEEYGECYRREISLFLSLERPLMLQTAKQIDGIVANVKKKLPISYRFMQALARGAKQDLATILKLSCHEELSHIQWYRECVDRTHCSVILARGKGGEAVLAQNWDWPKHYSLFSSVNRFDFKDAPRMLCYS
jgi:hypothetical protein